MKAFYQDGRNTTYHHFSTVEKAGAFIFHCTIPMFGFGLFLRMFLTYTAMTLLLTVFICDIMPFGVWLLIVAAFCVFRVILINTGRHQPAPFAIHPQGITLNGKQYDKHHVKEFYIQHETSKLMGAPDHINYHVAPKNGNPNPANPYGLEVINAGNDVLHGWNKGIVRLLNGTRKHRDKLKYIVGFRHWDGLVTLVKGLEKETAIALHKKISEVAALQFETEPKPAATSFKATPLQPTYTYKQ